MEFWRLSLSFSFVIHLYKQYSWTLRSAAAALSTEELGDLMGDSDES